MNLKCFFGFHQWKIINNEIGVIEKNYPYSSFGHMRVCALRECLICKKRQVSGITGEKPNGFWDDIIGYYSEDKIIDNSSFGKGALSSIIPKGTPIVNHISENILDNFLD